MTHEISNGKSKIRCPGTKCKKGEMEFKEVEELVDEELCRRFLQSTEDKSVFLSKQYKWCPKPDCNTVCNVQSKLLASKTTCPKCLKEFCSKCDQSWADHPEECKLISIENTVQPCPGCQVNIQKNKGCFAMECSFCKTEFCWNCLAKLNHLSFHFKCTDGRINWSFIPDIVDPLGILLSLNFVLYLSNVHPPTTNILIFKLTQLGISPFAFDMSGMLLLFLFSYYLSL